MAAATRELFVTQILEASLADDPGFAAFNAELADACQMLIDEDLAGRAWCKAQGFLGYTSYASLNDLTTRASIFADLARRLSRHAAAFSRALAHDLGPRGRLRLDSLWVNALPAKAAHSGHIHPLSVISGIVYVAAPPRSGALRLEDPRLPLMMAAPTVRADAPQRLARAVTIAPEAGKVVMWESWLRHEVLPGSNAAPRVSLSFNYAWR
jgi:uncharacterized protein (TIGR02466 family)